MKNVHRFIGSALIALSLILGFQNCGAYQPNSVVASTSSSTTPGPIQVQQPPTPALAPAPAPVVGTGPRLLPASYLSTKGNQYVDAQGNYVRIAAVGYNEPSWAPDDIPHMKAAGFNTLRYDWYDKILNQQLAQMDQIVQVAGQVGLKVIFDHHGNEATDSCLGQQSNGLWFDLGAGSNGTDGCGAKGTISAAAFQANWVMLAKRYAGNPTVVGFDLHNEPLVVKGGATWGGGGPTDIRAMYQTVGNAILAVNPGVLIICEGPENWGGNFANLPGVIAAEGDLTLAQSQPVVLKIPNKVVYSIHNYPTTISNINAVSVDSGPKAVARMNATWGYLVTKNIAPVWVGEMGADLDNANGQLADEQAWAKTLIDYMNGKDGALGGPTFSAGQQPISADWWAWGNLEGQLPDGTLNADGSLRAGQKSFWTQLLFVGGS